MLGFLILRVHLFERLPIGAPISVIPRAVLLAWDDAADGAGVRPRRGGRGVHFSAAGVIVVGLDSR